MYRFSCLNTSQNIRILQVTSLTFGMGAIHQNHKIIEFRLFIWNCRSFVKFSCFIDWQWEWELSACYDFVTDKSGNFKWIIWNPMISWIWWISPVPNVKEVTCTWEEKWRYSSYNMVFYSTVFVCKNTLY